MKRRTLLASSATVIATAALAACGGGGGGGDPGSSAATADAMLAASIRSDTRLAAVRAKAKQLVAKDFTAGSGYPAVFIRDLNTFVELAIEDGVLTGAALINQGRWRRSLTASIATRLRPDPAGLADPSCDLRELLTPRPSDALATPAV